MEHRDTLILWTAAPTAPISIWSDDQGCALVMGDALAPGCDQRTDAGTVLRSWLPPDRHVPAVYDGFHVAITVRGNDVAIGGDLLGLLPIMYAARDSVLLAGSSFSAFDDHPHFAARLDIEGLLAHLLVGGPVGGRTLRAGISRLGAGQLLRWKGVAPAREVLHYRAPHSVDAPSSLDDAVEQLDAALHAAVRRHSASHDRLTLLLSGGRDSRLIGGYARRDRTLAHAFTIGAPTDHDAMCAATVARTLHVPHQVHDIPFAHFMDHADRSLKHELLSAGMSSIHAWEGAHALRGSGGGLLSGYLLELRQIAPLPPTSAGMLAWTYAHAMSPEQLRGLLHPPLHQQLNSVVRQLERQLDMLGDECAAGEESNERSWRWCGATYARFHAGSVPWRYASSAWPILPMLDQAVLRTLCSIPAKWLENRRVQDAILRGRFPALARLPLDRNSHEAPPLVRTIGYRIKRAWQRTFSARSASSTERRFYTRIYDFDNPGWQLIRASAEPGREAMTEWFNGEVLARLVPPAGTPAQHSNPVADGFAPKLLTGFMRVLALRNGAAS